jgi:hypothetical protein
MTPNKEKTPPFGGVPLYYPCSRAPKLLVVLTVLAALLLPRPIALALRVLLLLAWLMATTLLAGILVLLAGILILLLRHWGNLPCWTSVTR